MGKSTSWLMVWNLTFIFPYIGNDHPNWRTHIFQRCWNHQWCTAMQWNVMWCTLLHCTVMQWNDICNLGRVCLSGNVNIQNIKRLYICTRKQYIRAYTYVYIRVNIYIYMYSICGHAYAHAHTHTHITHMIYVHNIFTHTHMIRAQYIYTQIYIYIYVCIYIYTHINIHNMYALMCLYHPISSFYFQPGEPRKRYV